MSNENEDWGDVTVTDGTRAAMKGKIPRSRRGPDKLNYKDWIGYAIAIGIPVVCNMLWTWHRTGLVEQRQDHFVVSRSVLVRDYNEKIEDLEDDLEKLETRYQRQWEEYQRLGDRVSDHKH